MDLQQPTREITDDDIFPQKTKRVLVYSGSGNWTLAVWRLRYLNTIRGFFLFSKFPKEWQENAFRWHRARGNGIVCSVQAAMP